MKELIDYSPEIDDFVEKGYLHSSGVISIPGPGWQQGDSILVREFKGDITTRIYHLRKRYFTELFQPSTYATATIEAGNYLLNSLVPFAWKRDDKGAARLRFGLLLKNLYPNGRIYQPNLKYDIGANLNLGDPSGTMEFWYPKGPLPLFELKGLKLCQALFRSAGGRDWEEFLIQHTNSADAEQNLSTEAQMAILNAVSKL